MSILARYSTKDKAIIIGGAILGSIFLAGAYGADRQAAMAPKAAAPTPPPYEERCSLRLPNLPVTLTFRGPNAYDLCGALEARGEYRPARFIDDGTAACFTARGTTHITLKLDGYVTPEERDALCRALHKG